MNILLLLLLLLVPSTAFAYVVYDITCDNVASIRIARVDDTDASMSPFPGTYHAVHFELKPEAAEAFVRLRDATPMIPLTYMGKVYPRENISIISRRRPLPIEVPALTAHEDKGITIFMVREADAFDLAKTVCPALVPAKVLINGQWEEPKHAKPSLPPVADEGPTASAGLRFDISCENVYRTVIIRHNDNFLGLHTTQGFFYSIWFDLKPNPKEEFRTLLERARNLHVHSSGLGHTREEFIITTNGKPLQNDAPEIGAHVRSQPGTILLLEKDAFDVARSVCPTAPIKLIIPPKAPAHGQRE